MFKDLKHRSQFLPGLQLLLTLLIIAFLPGNPLKLLALVAVWLITFSPISHREAFLFAFSCIFFSTMNFLSLKQGIFQFNQPDLLGMPVYEFFMWGFYLLHVTRALGGPAPEGKPGKLVWMLALLYSATFGAVNDPALLLLASGALLCLGLLFHHSKRDIAYTGYMILLGAAIEYTGVWSGQWHYPNQPFGGVPLWFLTLWGGVGFFLYRLVLPFLQSKVSVHGTDLPPTSRSNVK